jgi:hypothetical protein
MGEFPTLGVLAIAAIAFLAVMARRAAERQRKETRAAILQQLKGQATSPEAEGGRQPVSPCPSIHPRQAGTPTPPQWRDRK